MRNASKYLIQILRVLLGVFFISAGIRHFTNPEFFLAIMPPYIPFHEFCVFASGIVEIVGGLGILAFGHAQTLKIRYWSGLLLVATFFI